MSGPPEDSEAWKAQDKGPIILSVCWSVTAVSSLFVLGRILAGYQRGKFHWDDWFVMLAQFFSYASTAFSTMAIRYGNGKHMKLLSTEQQEDAIFWTTVAFCPGILSFGLPKLAVVSLLTRLMNPSRYHRYFLWFIGVFCQVVLLITAALLLTRCNPPNSLWDFSVAGTCFSANILVGFCIFAGSLSAFVDVYLAVYPSVVLFNLQMTLKKKVALSWALGIGVISGVVAIYKTTRIPSLGSADFSYDTSDLVIWTVVEGSTIIIASSIPIMRPLLEVILKRNPFSSAKGSKSTPQYCDFSGPHCKTIGSRIELSHRKRKSRPKDDLNFTIDDGDSQENILESSKNMAASTKTSASNDGQQSPRVAGKIVRTDEVNVVYETRDQTKDTNSSRRW